MEFRGRPSRRLSCSIDIYIWLLNYFGITFYINEITSFVPTLGQQNRGTASELEREKPRQKRRTRNLEVICQRHVLDPIRPHLEGADPANKNPSDRSEYRGKEKGTERIID